MSSKSELASMVSQPEDNDEENFKDAPEDQSSDDEARTKEASAQSPDSKTSSTKYDGRKREPLYSNADKTCLWEMTPFLSHFHPTVSLYAAHILSLQPIEGNPEFYQHALIHFLNRMVYKNPKKQRDDINTALGTKGSSIMQPMAAHRGMSIVLKRGGGNDVNVNTEAFWQKKVEDVPVDQVFFHKYFTQKKVLNPNKKAGQTAESDEDEEDFAGSKKNRKERGDDDDGDDNDSELDEDEVWNAMMSDMPKDVKGSIDDEADDLSDADLEELMLSDLDEDEEGSDREAGSDEEEDGEDGEDGEEDKHDDDDDGWEDEGDDEEASMFMDEADDIMASDEEAENDSDEEEQGRDKKRRKKAALPVFASMEDYAHLIDQDDSE